MHVIVLIVELNIKYLLLFTSTSSASSAHLIFLHLSPSGRLAIRSDLRTWGFVSEANLHISRLPWSVSDTTPNYFITKALFNQSYRLNNQILPVNFRLSLIAWSNRQRRMNGRAQRSNKRRKKCEIIVMALHRIRSEQDIEWRQHNRICTRCDRKERKSC